MIPTISGPLMVIMTYVDGISYYIGNARLHASAEFYRTYRTRKVEQIQGLAKLATTLAPLHYHKALFTLGFTNANTPRDGPDGPPANHKSRA